MYAEFTDNLVTGNEMIDSQHKELIERMNKLSKEANVNIVLLVSADKSELPEGIESLASQI